MDINELAVKLVDGIQKQLIKDGVSNSEINTLEVLLVGGVKVNNKSITFCANIGDRGADIIVDLIAKTLIAKRITIDELSDKIEEIISISNIVSIEGDGKLNPLDIKSSKNDKDNDDPIKKFLHGFN